MPNITRGGNARGLMCYLLGPGRANEHTDQRVLAGTFDIAGRDFFGHRPLTHAEALRVGKRLDLDRLEHGTEILAKRTRWDYDAEAIVSTGKGPAHVWHCSLTLHPDEGRLTDETWAKIASDFMDEMGFTEASGKAPCRWVAVRHGANAGGGDHIHIACVLVRDDGTKASVWRDYARAQAACNTLEHRHGLAVVESREHQRGSRGDSPAEQADAARKGQALTDRARLEIAIRAAAAGARTESEFLTELRGQGVLVRPRYARGTREHVDGFSVALTPAGQARPRWIGAGYVARDLSLRRLRSGWADLSTERRKALGLWTTARNPHHDHGPVRQHGRPWMSRQEWDSQQKAVWKAMADAVDESLARFDAILPGDDEGLAACARDAAGLFSTLARRYDGHHTGSRALAKAARSMGRLAQTKPPPTRRAPLPTPARARFARACLHTPHGPAQHDETIWTTATRLATALTETIELHNQITTARRTRADIEAALAALEPTPLRHTLLEQSFPDYERHDPTSPDPQAPPQQPGRGLSQTERLLATFAPIPDDTTQAPQADTETPPTPRRQNSPKRDHRRRGSKGMN